MAEKLPGYATLIKTKAYLKHWPQIDPTLNRDFPRVLFVTSSADRIRNICNHVQGLSPAHRYAAQHFRFTTHADLTPQKAFTDIWHTLAGQRKSILPNHQQPTT